MFITIKTRFTSLIIASLLLLVSFGFLLAKIHEDSYMINTKNITIVLDAGHGGIDGGSVGVNTKITEKELNLVYSKKLENYLKAFGIRVVQTRYSLDGLYDPTSKNLKESDMKRRAEIIEKTKPQAVVSIHMNKYTDSRLRGAQVFYNEENPNSINLANSIRDELVKNIEHSRDLTLSGDYYMVKCSNIPSVIVECGFLSNPDEEILLQDEKYQERICYTIFLGIIRYLNIKISWG